MHLAHYLGLLHKAQVDLADAFRQVGEGHREEVDVFHTCARLARQCDKHADQLQLLASRQERVERGLLGNVPQPAPVSDRVIADAAPLEQHHALRRFHQTRHHPPGRGLSRSVRSQVTDDFTRADDEADIVDHLDAVKALDQVPRFEKGRSHACDNLIGSRADGPCR